LFRLSFLAFVLFASTNAHAIFYWDGNGNAPGAGNAPSGTWDTTTANWWDSHGNPDDGFGTNTIYVNNVNVFFSHGSDATGSYTITVSGPIIVGDMHCDDGAVTLVGNPLQWSEGSTARLISALPDHVFTINCVLKNIIGTNDPGTFEAFRKYKMGTLVLGGHNTYDGSTIIEGGTLKLGTSNCIPDSSTLILDNGDTRPTDGFVDTPATFSTGGFNETLGTLRLTGPNLDIPRTIDFGNGRSTLSFADSSAEYWADIPLTIVNYTPGSDRLRFGTTSSGLTPIQLGLLRFDANAPGVIDNLGYVTPDLPVFTSIRRLGNPVSQVELTCTAIQGRTYRLEYRDTLSSSWNTLTDSSASGNSLTFTNSIGTGARFYRVELLP